MENEATHPYKDKVHRVLASSYSAYLLFFLVGVYLNLFLNLKVFSSSVAILIGLILLVSGTLLIIWAQGTSRNLKKENITKEAFSHGPYSFTRTPTNFGLFFLMLGFGMIANSLCIILCSIIAFFVAKFIFLKQEEKILAEKYGAPYLEYKKAVKF